MEVNDKGCPQASVLAPALFSVSISDEDSGIKSAFSTFAHDTKLNGVATHLWGRAIQSDLEKLKQWPMGTSEV